LIFFKIPKGTQKKGDRCGGMNDVGWKSLGQVGMGEGKKVADGGGGFFGLVCALGCLEIRCGGARDCGSTLRCDWVGALSFGALVP
jgi:hypothetical protein